MFVYTPLSGRFKSVLEFSLININSVFRVEKCELINELPLTDEGLIVWDYSENIGRYSAKYEVLIFIPVSPDFVSMIESDNRYKRELAQNYRFRENEFLSLFPVNRDTVQVAEIKLEHVVFSSDLVAQLFLLLTGYDELFSPKDQLNRTVYKGSLIEHFKLINRALVDETYLVFIFSLHSIGIPESVRMHDGYTWRMAITHDIDHLEKWTSGYFLRSMLSGSARRNSSLFKILKEFVRSLHEKDPYQESVSNLLDLDFKYDAVPVFFLRSGKSDKRDSIIDFQSDEIKNLVDHQVNGRCRTGIHPSIKSAASLAQMNSDWNIISKAIPSVEKINRQHFLMYEADKTPFIHGEMRFTEDYSVGFTDHEGLKRATVNPFYGFDFTNWKTVMVRYIPMIAMDVTFQDYRNISSVQAFQLTRSLIDEVVRYQGYVSILIHNSYTGSENPEWLEWFENVLKYSKEKYGLMR